jgi:hypothetical protein
MWPEHNLLFAAKLEYDDDLFRFLRALPPRLDRDGER